MKLHFDNYPIYNLKFEIFKMILEDYIYIYIINKTKINK